MTCDNCDRPATTRRQIAVPTSDEIVYLNCALCNACVTRLRDTSRVIVWHSEEDCHARS